MASVVYGQDISKQFGSGEATVNALQRVNVAFEAGTFTAIMGPSGSGKSTLMHLLAGLDEPTTGSISIDSQGLGELSDRQLTRLRRDKIGFIFQSFNLLPVLTAEENIKLPITLAGAKLDSNWYQELIDRFGLSDRLKHLPSELSGGQQQRVAVARALIHKPAVVFADEPTGNLDSAASKKVLASLRHAVDQDRQTIVMVTHDAHAAATADRVLFLNDGQITNEQTTPTAQQILDYLKSIS